MASPVSAPQIDKNDSPSSVNTETSPPPTGAAADDGSSPSAVIDGCGLWVTSNSRKSTAIKALLLSGQSPAMAKALQATPTVTYLPYIMLGALQPGTT